MVAVARKVAALDAVMGGSNLASVAAMHQMRAACQALEACGLVLQTLHTQPGTAPRAAAAVAELAPALAGLMRLGGPSLEACCAALQSWCAAGRAEEEAPWRLVNFTNYFIVAANIVFITLRDVGAASGSSGQALSPPFARWLSAVCRALLLGSGPDGGEAGEEVCRQSAGAVAQRPCCHVPAPPQPTSAAYPSGLRSPL